MKLSNLRSLAALSLMLLIPYVFARAQSLPNRVASVSWSADGSKIAAAYLNGTIRVQDTNTQQILFTLPSDNSGPTLSVIFNHVSTDNRLASGGRDGIVRIWNSNTGTLIRSITVRANDVITSLSWNPTNNNQLVSLTYGGLLNVWDTTTGNAVSNFMLSGGSNNIDWSQDGSKLVVTQGNKLNIYNATTGVLLTALNGANSELISVDWSTNLSRIVATTNLGQILIWNATNGSLITTLTGSFTNIPDGIPSVVFSPDSSLIASTSIDSKVRIWNVTNGQIVNEIQSSNSLFAVAWSPDGNKLVYGGDTTAITVVPAPGAPTFTPTPTPTPYPCPCTLAVTTFRLMEEILALSALIG